MPSGETSSTSAETDRLASIIEFPRALPRRNISVGLPSYVEIKALRLKRTLDSGRAALANIKPVTNAAQMMPTNASIVTSNSPKGVAEVSPP